DWSRRDRVDADSVPAPFNSQVLSQCVDAGLGRRDVKLHRRAEVMQRGADIQNLPAMLFKLSERRAAYIERAFQIDIHDRSESIRRKFLRGAKKISGGAVDYDIDFAEAFDGGGDGFLKFFGIAHVGGDGKGFASADVAYC